MPETERATVVVGQARRIDALHTLALRRQVLAEGEWFITRGDEFTGTVPDEERRVRELAECPNSVFLVARIRPFQVAGLVTIGGGNLARMRHVGKLEIMVDAAHRGQGVGRALLEAAVAWAEDNAVLEKIGLSVFATNERAIALYHSLGFVEEGRRPREYKLADGTYRSDVLLYRYVSSAHSASRR